MKILIRNGRIVDPATGRDEEGDLAVADGRFVTPEALPAVGPLEKVDAHGCIVAPGFVDVHVHLREPGQEAKETIGTGTRAAAAGGFTTILAMPNTSPPVDRPEHVADLRGRIRRQANVRVLISACLTLDRGGCEMADLAALAAEEGVVAFTDDGSCVPDEALMRRALEQAAKLGLPVLDHCEDVALKKDGVMRAGPVADRLGVPGMPPETESDIVARNIALARTTGARVHLQHLSCRRSVELLREARAEGLPVTGEITPHHLALTVDMLPILGANAKMNPPLGTEDDRQALLDALTDGTVGIIATDHAPHTPAEKARGLVAAPFGIIGLETALGVCAHELVDSGRLDWPRLIACLTVGPARLLGSPLGTLQPGRPADLVIIDPAALAPADIRRTQSKSANSPFQGYPLRGAIRRTMVAGNWAWPPPRG